MATVMTQKKAAGIAMQGVPGVEFPKEAGEAFVAMLPENCMILTDVQAFKDTLGEVYEQEIVSDSGNQSRVIKSLPEPTRRRIADLLEQLEG